MEQMYNVHTNHSKLKYKHVIKSIKQFVLEIEK